MSHREIVLWSGGRQDRQSVGRAVQGPFVAEVSIAWKVPEPTTQHSVFEHVKWSQVSKIIEDVVSKFEDELDKVLKLGQRSKWNTCQGCGLLCGRKLVNQCGEEASDSAVGAWRISSGSFQRLSSTRQETRGSHSSVFHRKSSCEHHGASSQGCFPSSLQAMEGKCSQRVVPGVKSRCARGQEPLRWGGKSRCVGCCSVRGGGQGRPHMHGLRHRAGRYTGVVHWVLCMRRTCTPSQQWSLFSFRATASDCVLERSQDCSHQFGFCGRWLWTSS